MIRKFALTTAAALTLSAGASLAAGDAEMLPHEGGHTHDVSFSFEGPFGTYDQMQLQRGLKIYTEGLHHGLVQSLRFMAMGLAGYAICFSTVNPRILTSAQARTLKKSKNCSETLFLSGAASDWPI